MEVVPLAAQWLHRDSSLTCTCLESHLTAAPGRWHNHIDLVSNNHLLPAKSKRNLPDFSLIYKVWGIFWEELKLKYAMFVQQLDKVKEDDILTFTFLGFKFFGKFKIRSV